MVEVSKADKYRRCGSCLSEENVRKISYYTNEQQQTTFMLCTKCISDLIFKTYEFERENIK